MTEIVKGFKGFSKDLKCQDHQFEIGKEYTYDGEVSLCNRGFHFCEHPLDVFSYYDAANSRFAEVEAGGVSDQRDSDTKRVCKTIRIKAEITFKAMIDAAIKFTFDHADWSKKENHVTEEREGSKTKAVSGAASATGDSGAASATGYRGAASATGYRGAASATGKGGCAVALGIEGKAQAAKGCWITLAEWENKNSEWHRIDVQTVQVDGKKIKAETWYTLQNGKFVAVR